MIGLLRSCLHPTSCVSDAALAGKTWQPVTHGPFWAAANYGITTSSGVLIFGGRYPDIGIQVTAHPTLFLFGGTSQLHGKQAARATCPHGMSMSMIVWSGELRLWAFLELVRGGHIRIRGQRQLPGGEPRAPATFTHPRTLFAAMPQRFKTRVHWGNNPLDDSSRS